MTDTADPPEPPAGDQLSLFGEGAGRMAPPVRNYMPDPEDIRRQLHALLTQARQASAIPWSERDLRMWEVVFPQMTSWLPDEEAEQLRFEFAQEVERLRAAA